jgi:hypothetical protein
MTSIMKHAIALTLAAAAVTSAVTPCFVQTARAQREVTQGVEYSTAQGAVYGAYPQQYSGKRRVNSDGFNIPAAVQNTPSQCWTDDGYGRWSSCDGAGG